MKILHIITGLNIGGAENMLAKLMEAEPHPDSQQVLSLLPRGPLAERIERTGVRVDCLDMGRGLATPAAALRLRGYVRAAKPDILHGWMYHGNLAASFARLAVGRRVPTIWNVRHSLADPRREPAKTRALLALSRPLSGTPDAIVYNSQAAALQHEAYGFSAGRRQVVPNGFDCAQYCPDPKGRERLEALFRIPRDAVVIGCVARLHPMKGHDNLARAFAIARQADARLHLLMVGRGLEEAPPELQALIGQGGLTSSGARFDIAEWMPGLDVLAMPSGWGEGFPNVIGEALLCGVPVVATDVGDSALVVGQEGIVVPPQDPSALAAALVRIAAMPPEQRAILGHSGRRRIERLYAIDAIVRRYHDLYASIAGAKPYAGLSPASASRS
ncbi:glycosyltransferase [Qipengyuania sp. 6B39]|uniref:glycosyltransferase n=1 Tax=Qipengyuania proteolytica TaxID=2867239 RepID=UPI001C8AEAFD|nr:glycosyltransferase [Qipengyuania proteolytica]MBX7495810.1 glycosyltransferase [Qipengyuania proteolytica]